MSTLNGTAPSRHSRMMAECRQTREGDRGSSPEVWAVMAVSWSTDRTELLHLLRQNNNNLGELYLQAVEALNHDVLIQPRLMVAGHCLRELFSNLPRVLGDPIKERTDVNRPARELFQAWTAEDLALTAHDDDGADDTPRAVPALVFRAAQAVASAASGGNQTSREVTAIVATGQLGNLGDASVNRLHMAIEFFREWAHASDYSKPDRVLPSVEKVEMELRIIEESLLTRLGNMANRARAMRQIIANANRRTTGGTS